MAVIKRADADRFARAAVTLHLGDLNREGDGMIAAAKQRAEAIIAEARAERERLILDAAEQGHAEGLARGTAEGSEKGREEGAAEALRSFSEDITGLTQAWTAALDRFETDRARMLAEARRDILRVAAIFAERVVKRTVELDATIVAAQLDAVVASVVRPSRLVLAVHPDDLETARRALPAAVQRFESAEHAELVGDASLRRGSCVARMPGGAAIDGSIDGQIERMTALLLPEEPRPAADTTDDTTDNPGEAGA